MYLPSKKYNGHVMNSIYVIQINERNNPFSTVRSTPFVAINKKGNTANHAVRLRKGHTMRYNAEAKTASIDKNFVGIIESRLLWELVDI